MSLLILACLCCVGAGLVLQVQPSSGARNTHQNQLQATKTQLHAALRRSAALPVLQARSEQLSARLAAGTAQVDDEPLQTRLGATVQRCGLALLSIRPLADGAELSVAGNYDSLLLLVAELSQTPHALLFESLDISMQRAASPPALLMKASVRRPSLSAATNQEPAHP
ncbi:hypothetical protein [Herbaspirillum sp. YR522]|uniref:hypothetical protein n=1 Tax=Herbaspirillum sp. YR522 TaxID=1144342 RepID=UPI0012FAD12B|nr:hypothetical protein [Herbaspirillum sp. YR522]